MRGNAKIFCLYRMQKPNFVRSPASKHEIVEMTIVNLWRPPAAADNVQPTTRICCRCCRCRVWCWSTTSLNKVQDICSLATSNKLLAEIIRTRPEQLVLPVPLQWWHPGWEHQCVAALLQPVQGWQPQAVPGWGKECHTWKRWKNTCLCSILCCPASSEYGQAWFIWVFCWHLWLKCFWASSALVVVATQALVFGKRARSYSKIGESLFNSNHLSAILSSPPFNQNHHLHFPNENPS